MKDSTLGEGSAGDRPEYEIVDGCTVWNKPDNAEPVVLARFHARILERVVTDDGVESSHQVTLAVTCQGTVTLLTISAKSFASGAWIEERIGAHAVVEVGFAFRDRLRAAIQHVSGSPPVRIVYRHVGWRAVGGVNVYLTATGGIGPDGPVAGVAVEAPDALRPLSLPVPSDPAALVHAVRASLRLLEAAPSSVAYPVYGSIWRSLLGPSDFVLSIVGATGQFKTAYAALAQQHFGKDFEPAHLPGNWSSTENALEELIFLSKNMVVVIDEFTPGSASDRGRHLQAKAERIYRSVGNRHGRQRMKPDTTVRPGRPPQATVFSTGEDLPEGQSVRARSLIVELRKGDISADLLSACQLDAHAGLYASATAGFVMWLARQLPRVQHLAPRWVKRLSRDLPSGEGHRRAVRNGAELLVGLRVFLAFACEVGAIDLQVAARYRHAARTAIAETIGRQADYQETSDPTTLFLRALRAAIVGGSAHLTTIDGGIPELPAVFGWRSVGGNLWRPMGRRIGWVDGNEIYVEPTGALLVARQMDSHSVTVSQETLLKRLHEAGHLADVDARGGKTRFRVRRTIEGRRISVLHLVRSSLVDDVAQVAPPPVRSGPETGGSLADFLDGDATPPPTLPETPLDDIPPDQASMT